PISASRASGVSRSQRQSISIVRAPTRRAIAMNSASPPGAGFARGVPRPWSPSVYVSPYGLSPTFIKGLVTLRPRPGKAGLDPQHRLAAVKEARHRREQVAGQGSADHRHQAERRNLPPPVWGHRRDATNQDGD